MLFGKLNRLKTMFHSYDAVKPGVGSLGNTAIGPSDFLKFENFNSDKCRILLIKVKYVICELLFRWVVKSFEMI